MADFRFSDFYRLLRAAERVNANVTSTQFSHIAELLDVLQLKYTIFFFLVGGRGRDFALYLTSTSSTVDLHSSHTVYLIFQAANLNLLFNF